MCRNKGGRKGTVVPLFIMINKDFVAKLVEEQLVGTDKFLVGLSVSVNNNIKVYLDSDTQLSIDDCAFISRKIEENLDREQEDYELQVSSAGIDSPLVNKRQYVKNIGRDIKLTLNNSKEFKGNLLDVTDEEITINYRYTKKQGKKRVKLEEKKTFPFSEIKTAKIVISF